MLGEWLRDWVFTGFPWLAFGYSQIDSPLRGYAPLAGVFGLSWLVWLCAGLLLALLRPKGRSSAIAALATSCWAGLPPGRIEWTRPQGAPITVSLLQGNIAQELKWDRGAVCRHSAAVSAHDRTIKDTTYDPARNRYSELSGLARPGVGARARSKRAQAMAAT